MAIAKVVQLHIDYSIAFELFDPNNNNIQVLNENVINECESENITNPLGYILSLPHDGEEVSIIPSSFSGVKFMLLRVMTENLAVAPADGTITAKITTADHVEQTFVGNFIVLKNKDADITEIKLINNEPVDGGSILPVYIMLGGK
ncbi:MAG: hypothetical protein WCY30_00180 [Candidatus Neomarinimicrobiota bacterium]|jgi:hypothetical protein